MKNGQEIYFMPSGYLIYLWKELKKMEMWSLMCPNETMSRSRPKYMEMTIKNCIYKYESEGKI